MTELQDEAKVVVREDERGFAAACHLLAAVPLWGIVFLAGIWIYFKERSREVVFHVQQAMMFQMVLLAVGVFALVVQMIALPMNVLHSGLSNLITTLNTFFLITVYTAYVCVCLWGVVQTMMGRPFLYPLIGRRVLEGNLTKSQEV